MNIPGESPFKINSSQNAPYLVAESIDAAVWASWVTTAAVFVGCSSTVLQT